MGLMALLGLAVAVFAIASLNGSAWAADSVGTIKKIRPDAYGTPPDGSRARKFARYDVVFGEVIETSDGAAILIKMDDDTELFMGERATMTIDEFVYEPGSKTGRAVYNFTVGTLRFVSGAMNDDRVTIQTPNANIGIRGSEAIIFVTPDGETTVNVTKGIFSVRSRDRGDKRPPVELKANQNVSLSGATTFSPVGVSIKVPSYSPAPDATDAGIFDGPDHSEDLKDIKSGGKFDRSKTGKVKSSRGGSEHDHHDDGHDGHGGGH